MLKRVNLINRSNISNLIRNLSTGIDQREIDKFDKFSKSECNWYTSELIRPLRNLNNLRVPLIRNQLLNDKQFKNEIIDQQLPLKSFKLLDIGCGGGLLSECLSRLGANVVGLDANENNIWFAKDHLKNSDLNGKLDYVHSDLDAFTNNILSKSDSKNSSINSSKDNSINNQADLFDGIIASEILEHVNDVDSFIKNCSSLLKHNGLLFITTINQTAQSFLFAILLAENVLRLAPKQTHQYDKLVLLNGLRFILEESKYTPPVLFIR